jgi:hypothetical protein
VGFIRCKETPCRVIMVASKAKERICFMNRIFRFIRFVFVKNAFKKIKASELCDAVIASHVFCFLVLVITIGIFCLSALSDEEAYPHLFARMGNATALCSIAAVILGFVGKFGSCKIKIPKRSRKAKLLNEKISLGLQTLALILQLQVLCGLIYS